MGANLETVFACVDVQQRQSCMNAASTRLLAHEDKTYSGAMIASLSIPWGDQRAMTNWAAITWFGPGTW